MSEGTGQPPAPPLKYHLSLCPTLASPPLLKGNVSLRPVPTASLLATAAEGLPGPLCASLGSPSAFQLLVGADLPQPQLPASVWPPYSSLGLPCFCPLMALTMVCSNMSVGYYYNFLFPSLTCNPHLQGALAKCINNLVQVTKPLSGVIASEPRTLWPQRHCRCLPCRVQGFRFLPCPCRLALWPQARPFTSRASTSFSVQWTQYSYFPQSAGG